MRRFLAWLCVAFAAAAAAAFLSPAFAAHEIGKEDAGKKPTILRLKDDGIVAEFTIEGKGKLSVTSKGIPLPAGTYTIKAISILKKDDKGKTWELRTVSNDDAGKADKSGNLRSAGRLGSLDTLIIDEGQEKVINPGPPLNFKCSGRQSTQNRSQVVIGARLQGQYSEQYYPWAFQSGRAGAVPTFHIVAEDGKVLYTGKFDVAKEGLCQATWLPGSWKGKYSVTIDADLGPYQYSVSQLDKLFHVD